MAKYRLGLPNAIGGTGFIVKMEYLMKHGGFRFDSLTEDLELEMEIVKDNGRVLWNHFVQYTMKNQITLKLVLNNVRVGLKNIGMLHLQTLNLW